jgi:Na+/melibiose symporter-like transporter
MESQNQNDDEKTLVMTMISAYAVGLVLGILAFYLVFKGMGKKTSAFLKSGLGLGASILVFFPASYITFFIVIMAIMTVANAGNPGEEISPE